MANKLTRRQFVAGAAVALPTLPKVNKSTYLPQGCTDLTAEELDAAITTGKMDGLIEVLQYLQQHHPARLKALWPTQAVADLATAIWRIANAEV